MKKKIIIYIMLLILILLVIYPFIEFKYNNHLYMFSYSKDLIDSKDFQNLEDELCFDESYAYNKKRNITITHYEYKKVLFFKYIKAKYQEGNICDTEYILEESYIKNFIENANIIENEDSIDLKELIKDKKPIIKNKRYTKDENYSYIEYELDGKNMSMYIFTTNNNLLVIQVGLGDEGPKFIAYK